MMKMIMTTRLVVLFVFFLFQTGVVVVLSAENQKMPCNICGEGNIILDFKGVVTMMYDGTNRTNNCQTWQQIAHQGHIKEEYCQKQMLQYTARPCHCATQDGQQLVTSDNDATWTHAPKQVEQQQQASSAIAATTAFVMSTTSAICIVLLLLTK